jgi:quinol monooxygenase YgiN
MQVMIRWKIKPGQVERELELLREVYAELRAVRPDGLRYATFRLDDEVTFVDIVELDEGPEVLRRIEAFQRYRSTLDERCDEVPVITTLHQVDCYGSSRNAEA